MCDIDLSTFNLNACVESTNLLLWDFICACTRSVRERSGRANSDDKYTRNIRRFFIICQILFTTNSSCATTLHHLIADTVEVHGGSRQLIKVLNRLGACLANDTHDRLVTDVAEKQRAKPLWSELSQDVFTIASADNIDFLQSHAAVYSGDQSQSYHGTTIQVVQPVPSVKLTATPSAICTPQITTCVSSCQSLVQATKRLCSSSPSNSPHQQGKSGPKRRRRTIAISPIKPANTIRQEETTPNQFHKQLKIERFFELESEIESKTRLHKEVFAYFLQKFTKQSSDLEEVLKPLREFILPTAAQLADHSPSLIYYLELLDENADSQETMTEVSELVLEKLFSQNQKWVVLVGDGKTYEHLQKIKRLYGSAFDKLLIFPGDWHVLKISTCSYEGLLP